MKALYLLIPFFCALTCGAEKEARLHFPAQGFSIAPLASAPGPVPQQTLMMFLPGKSGFAANVNVQIQPYAGSIQEYAKLSNDQFKESGLTLNSEKITGQQILWEYSGELQGRALHWYAKAVKSGGHIYLATATSLESDWESLAAQLKECVHSMKVPTSDPQPAPEK